MAFIEVKVHVHIVPHVVILLEVLVEPARDVLELVAWGRHRNQTTNQHAVRVGFQERMLDTTQCAQGNTGRGVRQSTVSTDVRLSTDVRQR